MKTYEHVYDILSKSPDFVTGESLAKSLGVSRTAIWKAIQTLQEQGIDITSVRKKGYYLEKGDILLPQDISKQLNIPVYFNPDSNSTQLDAKHGMEKINPTPALYLASSQKAAKGRFERHFFASPQGGIYMSIHLKPNCHFEELPPYTMMVAAAIVKAIQRLTGINTEIMTSTSTTKKWLVSLPKPLVLSNLVASQMSLSGLGLTSQSLIFLKS